MPSANPLLHRPDAEQRPSGFYTAERECSRCEFRTWSRDEFWKHFFAHHDPEKAPLP